MESSFWVNAKLCVDKHYRKDISKMIIRAFLSKNCGFSSFVLSNIDTKYEQNAIISKTRDIFELIMLHNFRPNLLSTIILKLMERDGNWSEFDKSIITNQSRRIWWYTALESVLIPNIDPILANNLKTLINDSMAASLITQEIDQLYKSNEIESFGTYLIDIYYKH